MQVQSLVQEDPLEWEMVTCFSILAWKSSMDKRSLVGYSPWGRKELDTSEHIHTDTDTHTQTHTHTHTPFPPNQILQLTFLVCTLHTRHQL